MLSHIAALNKINKITNADKLPTTPPGQSAWAYLGW